jgi:hypothetical protein
MWDSTGETAPAPCWVGRAREEVESGWRRKVVSVAGRIQVILKKVGTADHKPSVVPHMPKLVALLVTCHLLITTLPGPAPQT